LVVAFWKISIMEEVKIPLSKKKITLLFFISAGFVVVSSLLCKSAPLTLTIALGIVILFFGFCAIYAIIKFFDNKPGFVINDEGIIDNSSATKAGIVKWENITDVSVITVYDQELLRIEVKNADEILSKQKGLKKILMNWNNIFFGSPVLISSNALNCNFKDLHDLIKAQLSVRHVAKTENPASHLKENPPNL